MKHIVAIWHSAGKGKSETVRQLANQFLTLYPSAITVVPTTIPISGDFRLVIEININGKIITIAFESQGDPGTNIEKRLDYLASKYNCDIIFCTCRTRGETVVAIETVASKYGYDIIWSSTYQINGKTNQQIANRQKADHIIQLLKSLSII